MKRALALSVFLIATGAHAEDDSPPDVSKILPFVTFDVGAGLGGPTLPSRFADEGFSFGKLAYGALHFFPLPFRWLGFFVRADATVMSTKDALASDAPTVFTVVGGPEAQLRIDSVLLRGMVLAGMRTVGDGILTTVDARLGFQLELDVVRVKAFGGSGPMLGFFAGLDAVPGIGWTFGATTSFALF